MFQKLPTDIQALIYEWDPTWKDYYRLQIVSQFKYTKCKERGDQLYHCPATGHFQRFYQDEVVEEWYEKKNRMHGSHILYFGKGDDLRVARQTQYKDGKKHGEEREYFFFTRSIKHIFRYEEDCLTHAFRYFDHGALFSQTVYDAHGKKKTLIMYHRNGDVKLEKIWMPTV
jgi:antitoxin component YwqK of YwqJK toxin-antitoxin module